jgi:hypothetical protein
MEGQSKFWKLSICSFLHGTAYPCKLIGALSRGHMTYSELELSDYTNTRRNARSRRFKLLSLSFKGSHKRYLLQVILH